MDPNQPQPQPAPQPVAPQPQPAPSYQPVQENPGKGLGIAGLIISFFIGLLGLILSIVALSKSKKAGMGNGVAVAGIIVGALSTLGQIIAGIFIILAVIGAAAITKQCQDAGGAGHTVTSGSTVFYCTDNGFSSRSSL